MVNNNSAIRKTFYIILVFMYIFMFRVVGPIDSSMVLGCFLLVNIINNRKAQKRLKNIICTDAFIGLLGAFAFLCLWIVAVTIINQTYDFSFVKTWLHVLIQVIIGLFVYCYLYSKGQTKSICNYIIIAFILQSAIEWLALLSPVFKAFIYSTKTESVRRIANQYSGIRGLSLAGSSFFGLAISFGLVYILYLSSYNTLFKKHSFIKFLCFVFLVSGTFFAGRTGLVGLAIALILGLIRVVSGRIKLNMKYVFGIIIILLIGIGSFAIIAHSFRDVNIVFKRIGYLYDYVFEALISLFNGKGLSTSSTSELFSEMYFSMPFKTLVIGDGYYTDPFTGSYYMNTDSGYMRVILYLGLPGLVMMLVFQYYIFKMGHLEKHIRRLLWIFIIILQVKGETIGFSMMFQSMILLAVLQNSSVESVRIGAKNHKDKSYKYFYKRVQRI